MKILNLYCGIGGNRQLWTPNGDEHKITAVEYNEHIAAVYKDRFPNDTVIVGDAHQYLLDHYKEFDFIWASPPCPTHSRLCFSKKEKEYPDMKLYQEIIILKSYAPKKTKWVIENVIPFYDYLIEPNVILHRHPFWANFNIPFYEVEDKRTHMGVKEDSTVYGVSLDKYKIDNKRQILRNMVNPEVGKYILDRAMEKEILVQNGLFE